MFTMKWFVLLCWGIPLTGFLCGMVAGIISIRRIPLVHFGWVRRLLMRVSAALLGGTLGMVSLVMSIVVGLLCMGIASDVSESASFYRIHEVPGTGLSRAPLLHGAAAIGFVIGMLAPLALIGLMISRTGRLTRSKLWELASRKGTPDGVSTVAALLGDPALPATYQAELAVLFGDLLSAMPSDQRCRALADLRSGASPQGVAGDWASVVATVAGAESSCVCAIARLLQSSDDNAKHAGLAAINELCKFRKQELGMPELGHLLLKIALDQANNRRLRERALTALVLVEATGEAGHVALYGAAGMLSGLASQTVKKALTKGEAGVRAVVAIEKRAQGMVQMLEQKDIDGAAKILRDDPLGVAILRAAVFNARSKSRRLCDMLLSCANKSLATEGEHLREVIADQRRVEKLVWLLMIMGLLTFFGLFCAWAVDDFSRANRYIAGIVGSGGLVGLIIISLLLRRPRGYSGKPGTRTPNAAAQESRRFK